MNNKDNKPFFKIAWFWISLSSILIAIICLIITTVNTSKSAALNKKTSSMSQSYSKAMSFNRDFEKYLDKNVPNYSSYVSDAVDSVLNKTKNDYSDDDENANDTASSSSEELSYSYGKAVSFNNESDDTNIDVTIVSAGIDENYSSQLNNPPTGTKPMVVTIKMKNTGNSAYDFNPQEFNAYDSEGNTLNFDSGTYNNTMPSSVNVGQTVSIKIFFDAKNDGPFSVTFADGTWK